MDAPALPLNSFSPGAVPVGAFSSGERFDPATPSAQAPLGQPPFFANPTSWAGIAGEHTAQGTNATPQLTFPNDASVFAPPAQGRATLQPEQQPPSDARSWPGTPAQGWNLSPSGAPDFAPQPTNRAQDTGKPRWTTRQGLAISSLCMITGMLLLLLVFIIAQTNPALTSSTTAAAGVQTPIAKVATPTPTPPLPTPTPTPAYPGQQYIDHAQMGTLDAQGQNPSYTSSFTVNQKIYVIFSLHPGGQSGAVCFKWYLNSQLITRWQYAVDGTQNDTEYSYASMATPGPGAVEIYWATSTATCSSGSLAQKATFTVTN